MIKNYVQLPDLEFIAGSAQSLEIEVYDNAGNAYDLSNATVKMTVGEGKNQLLEKSLSVSEGAGGIVNMITVVLTSPETSTWDGRYRLQIQIIFSAANTIIPAEMLMIVHSKIRGDT